jgi:fluoride exporter
VTATALWLVLVGGAVGAIARHLTDRAILARFDPAFPWGTFAVNVVGSLVLGAVSGLAAGAVPPWIGELVGVGFCGALTTYSTFGYETVRLASAGAWRLAAVNAAGTVLAGLGACWLGWALTG